MSRSVDFFERQFRSQASRGDYALNPFEQAILPHLRGEVLDLGCGLGNLSLAAAKAGCTVTALDASPSAIADLARRAAGLPLKAKVADLSRFKAWRQYDCVVCIGLLMFFPCEQARAALWQVHEAVGPGGIAAVNVLVEGTTYTAMFDPAGCCLFGRDELTTAFEGWQPVYSRHEDFPAPEGTVKRFHTLVARRP